MTKRSAYILLDDQLTHTQRYYTDPVEIISAQKPEEVDAAFEKIMDYHAKGFYLAGYLSYELGFILENKLRPRLPENRLTPLLHLAAFKTLQNTAPTDHLYSAAAPVLNLTPRWNETQYTKRFKKVMSYIKAGDVYQINLTFPMSGSFTGPAHKLYAGFRHRQKGRYGGIISLGQGPDIISLSPELFFRKEGLEMSMRPMKGTRPRANDDEDDEVILQSMRNEVKSQAENLMIVDLLRNDLSRICAAGSVKVPELFTLETYPTLHQMTSRVMAKLKPDIDIYTIFKSLFPCGSVTGAPKIRAMEIIDELEGVPRGAYCGALGYIDPSGDACFNVGIRTLTLDQNRVTYNVGSGLVLDSNAKAEYKECLLKADVLKAEPTSIIETFKWDPKSGFIRGERHKSRMKAAALSFGYPFKSSEYDKALMPVREKAEAQHVRLTLSPDGTFSLTHKDYVPLENVKIVISEHRLSDEVQFSAHKISRRNFYDGERERLKQLTGANEVIFMNEAHQICEGSFTSVFIESGEKLLTPSLRTGILPGILRAELLQTGKAKEANISLTDMTTAEKVYIGNSLRGLMRARVIETPKAL